MIGEGGIALKEQIQAHLKNRIEQFFHRETDTFPDVEIKKELFARRKADLIKVKADAQVLHISREGKHCFIEYQAHMQYLIKQKEQYYIEENVENRKASFYNNRLYEDQEMIMEYPLFQRDESNESLFDERSDDTRLAFVYDRMKAVQYAERWWNEFNPAYKKFIDDCTNFISQCLHAGGAPMRGYPNRSQGWWMRNNNWSYSWAVANSLKTYLSYSKTGLRTNQVSSPEELKLGDVICYDFQGDGRFDHNTMITGFDVYGMPLVNAHTSNSRKRYWSYEDSSAYTPNIQYKFFSIQDDRS